MKSKSSPVIRMQGFNNEWQQVKLSDKKDVRDGTHDSPKYHIEGFPLITSKNLKEQGLDFSDVSFITKEDFDQINKRSKVSVDDILFGMIGTIGNPVLVETEGFAIKNVALIKNGGEIENIFLINLLKSSIFEEYIRGENAGNTQKFLSLSKIRNFEFYIPIVPEQIQIGYFFKKINEIINIYQQELETLKQTKKGFLQKMFPKEGESLPEVRFDGFDDEWKTVFLKDVLKVNSGRDYKHLSEGNVPVYGTGGYMFSVNESLSEIDAIGIGRKGTIDKPRLLEAPFWTVDTLFYMTVIDDNDLAFFYSLANKINWKSLDESTGVPSLSKLNIEKLKISIPTNEEQIKIGEFFRQLDETIALHEKELEALKETKKAFLQKMFV